MLVTFVRAKMVRPLVASIMTTVLLAGCAAELTPPTPACSGSAPVHAVTVTQLANNAVNRASCDGRLVRIRGFARWDFEAQLLYDSPADLEDEVWQILSYQGASFFPPHFRYQAVFVQADWVENLRFDQQVVVVEGRFAVQESDSRWVGLLRESEVQYADVRSSISVHPLTNNFRRLFAEPPPPPWPGGVPLPSNARLVLNAPGFWLAYRDVKVRRQ